MTLGCSQAEGGLTGSELVESTSMRSLCYLAELFYFNSLHAFLRFFQSQHLFPGSLASYLGQSLPLPALDGSDRPLNRLLTGVSQSQQLKIICLMQAILASHPILNPITLEILEEIQYSQAAIEVIARVQGISEEKVEIIIVEGMIMIYLQQKNSTFPLAYLRMDSSLRFQRNFRTQKLSRILTGIRLTNDKFESITFEIESPTDTASLVQYLSRSLNQTDFHNLYRPVKRFGKGSFATVYEVVRLDDGRRFACKAFSKDPLKADHRKMRSFISQIEILRFVEHQNLLKLDSVFETDTAFYLIMEALGADNLFEYLIKANTALTIEEIQHLMRHLLSGLSELAKDDIVHRDIKLQNIMLREENILDPVIIDFGLAIFEDDEDYNYYHCGTPGYISPEVLTVTRGGKVTPKSDVFSAGVILHVLLTGKYLFQGKTIPEVFENNKKMAFSLEKIEHQKDFAPLFDLMRKMLEIDPLKRYSADECLMHESLATQVSELSQSQEESLTI